MDSVAYIYKETETVNEIEINVCVLQVAPGQVLVDHSRFYLVETNAINPEGQSINDTATVFYNREQALRSAITEFDRLIVYYAEQDSDDSTRESVISSMRN